MTPSPNGQLPPAPPATDHQIARRLDRLEQLSHAANQTQLRRDINAISAELATVASQVYLLRETRQAWCDCVNELASAMLRQQRIIDRLERKLSEAGQDRDVPASAAEAPPPSLPTALPPAPPPRAGRPDAPRASG